MCLMPFYPLKAILMYAQFLVDYFCTTGITLKVKKKLSCNHLGLPEFIEQWYFLNKLKYPKKEIVF